MRPRNEDKQKSVIDATITVVNKQGFSNASIAKIATEAGVSPATIYVYYRDKTDLIVSVYYAVKADYSRALYDGLSSKNSVKKNLKIFWDNVFELSDTFAEVIFYTQQLSHSPYYDMLDKKRVMKNAEPLLDLLQRGKQEKVIRDISFEMFMAFFFVPANFLSDGKVCTSLILKKERSEAFEIAWKSIAIWKNSK